MSKNGRSVRPPTPRSLPLRPVAGPARTSRRRLVLVLAAGSTILVAGGVVAALSLTGKSAPSVPTAASAASTGSSSGPRPLTSDEAGRFALARFNLYRQSQVSVAEHLPESTGVVDVAATVDFPRQRAVGTYSSSAGDNSTTPYGAIAWTTSSLSIVSGVRPVAGSDQPPSGVSANSWQASELEQRDPVDAMLVMTLQLGQDRPDNSQLLAESDARWLGRTTIGSVPVDEFQAPSATAANPASGAATSGSGVTASPAAAGSTASRLVFSVDDQGRLWRVVATGPLLPAPATIDLRPTGPAAPMEAGPFTS
jgi:hypothetical protein